MTKNLVKHGNSHALILDKAILELLRIDPETTALDIVTDGNVLIVTPLRAKKAQKDLADRLAKYDKKYGSVFKKLAE
ncbi:MAG: AbrB/MazE/SpoVT family DNA-binding domain-containing protein [Cyanobacteriota/Melainabacteria group bacterium]